MGQASTCPGVFWRKPWVPREPQGAPPPPPGDSESEQRTRSTAKRARCGHTPTQGWSSHQLQGIRANLRWSQGWASWSSGCAGRTRGAPSWRAGIAPSATWEKLGYRSSPLKVAADLSFPICVEGLPPIPVSPPALVSWAWPPRHPAVWGWGNLAPSLLLCCLPPPTGPRAGLGRMLGLRPARDFSVPYLQGCRVGTKKNKKTHPPLDPNSFPAYGLAMSAMQGPRGVSELGRHPQQEWGLGRSGGKGGIWDRRKLGCTKHILCALQSGLLPTPSITPSSHTGSSSLLLGHHVSF